MTTITEPDLDAVLRAPSARGEDVALLDTDLPARAALAAGLAPGIALVDAPANSQGLGALAAALEGRAGPVRRLHLLCHGAPGRMVLAGGRIDATALRRHPAALARIAAALAPGAEIVLYGCAVARGAEGRAFVAELAAATGARVAASATPTGAAWRGGDWNVSFADGTPAPRAIEAGTRAAWPGLLIDLRITRETPAQTRTNADTVTWLVEIVGGGTITASTTTEEFILNETGDVMSEDISSATFLGQSDASFTIEVENVSGDGSLSLGLAPGNSFDYFDENVIFISGAAGTISGDSETDYIIDNTPPQSPSSSAPALTTADDIGGTFTFTLDYDEPLSPFTGSAVADAPGSNADEALVFSGATVSAEDDTVMEFVFDVVEPLFTISEDEIPFDITGIEDLAGNAVNFVGVAGSDIRIPVSSLSISRADSAPEGVNGPAVTFLVEPDAFDLDPSTVDTADFAVSGTGSGTVSSVTEAAGPDQGFRVEVDVSAPGTIGLDVAESFDIETGSGEGDLSNLPAIVRDSPESDQTYDVALVPRIVSASIADPSIDQSDIIFGDIFRINLEFDQDIDPTSPIFSNAGNFIDPDNAFSDALLVQDSANVSPTGPATIRINVPLANPGTIPGTIPPVGVTITDGESSGVVSTGGVEAGPLEPDASAAFVNAVAGFRGTVTPVTGTPTDADTLVWDIEFVRTLPGGTVVSSPGIRVAGLEPGDIVLDSPIPGGIQSITQTGDSEIGFTYRVEAELTDPDLDGAAALRVPETGSLIFDSFVGPEQPPLAVLDPLTGDGTIQVDNGPPELVDVLVSDPLITLDDAGDELTITYVFDEALGSFDVTNLQITDPVVAQVLDIASPPSGQGATELELVLSLGIEAPPAGLQIDGLPISFDAPTDVTGNAVQNFNAIAPVEILIGEASLDITRADPSPTNADAVTFLATVSGDPLDPATLGPDDFEASVETGVATVESVTPVAGETPQQFEIVVDVGGGTVAAEGEVDVMLAEGADAVFGFNETAFDGTPALLSIGSAESYVRDVTAPGPGAFFATEGPTLAPQTVFTIEDAGAESQAIFAFKYDEPLDASVPLEDLGAQFVGGEGVPVPEAADLFRFDRVEFTTDPTEPGNPFNEGGEPDVASFFFDISAPFDGDPPGAIRDFEFVVVPQGLRDLAGNAAEPIASPTVEYRETTPLLTVEFADPADPFSPADGPATLEATFRASEGPDPVAVAGVGPEDFIARFIPDSGEPRELPDGALTITDDTGPPDDGAGTRFEFAVDLTGIETPGRVLILPDPDGAVPGTDITVTSLEGEVDGFDGLDNEGGRFDVAIDATPPRIASVELFDPATSPAEGISAASFLVTFTESVVDFDPADLAVLVDGAREPGFDIALSEQGGSEGEAWIVELSGDGFQALEGELGLDFVTDVTAGEVVKDEAGNFLDFAAPETNETLVVDNAAAPLLLGNDMIVVAEGETTDDLTAALLSNDSGEPPLEITGVDAAGLTGGLAFESVVYTASGFDALGEGESATDRFTYDVSSGNGSGSATVTVTVTGVNDDPEATADGAEVLAGGTVVIDAAADDTDVDSTGLVVTDAAIDEGGGEVRVEDGRIVYDTAGAFADLPAGGTAEVVGTYRVEDPAGGFDVGAFTVTVTGRNDPPVAGDDSATTDEDTPGTADVLANDSDPDGDALEILSASVPAGSGLANADITIGEALGIDPRGAFDDLAEGQTRTVAVTYTVGDGNGGEDTATATFTITGVNDPPVAGDDTGTAAPGTTATFDVLANDADVDGTDLEITGISGGGGAASIAGNAIEVDTSTLPPLADGETATLSILYTVADGDGGTDTATLEVTVTGENAAPEATDDRVATDEDTPLAIDATGNDTDPDDDPLAITDVDAPAEGEATVGDGIDFDPAGAFDDLGPGESRSVSFDYTVSDGNGGEDAATVTVTVSGVNDAPEAGDDTASAEAGTTATIDVLANDSDVDGGPLSIAAAEVVSGGGGVTVSGDALVFDPRDDFDTLASDAEATATLAYTVSDGRGGEDTATVTVSVTNPAAPPVTRPDTLFLGVRDAVGFVDVLSNDTDPDGGALSSETTLTRTGFQLFGADGTPRSPGPLAGPVSDATITATGGVTYEPLAAYPALGTGERGVETFTYTAVARDGDRTTGELVVTRSGGGDDQDIIAEGSTIRGRDEIDDQIVGAGANEIDAGPGNDVVGGGDGDDTLIGGPGRDELDGESGDDVLRGGADDDVLDGGTGIDSVAGAGGNDKIFGGAGADELDGADGNDLVSGGGGDDLVIGGPGNDGLLGGAGADTLVAGAGEDGLLGGAGPDVFVFSPGDGTNTIGDFDAGEDVIRLSGFGGLTPGDALANATSGAGLLFSAEGTRVEITLATPTGLGEDNFDIV